MISLAVSGPVATIALDRVRTRNAIDARGWRQLASVLAEAETARVLVLRSAVPGAFCAGSDLNEMSSLVVDREARAAFRAIMREAIDGLAGLAIPTVAAIDGDCFGAGVALALGCDLRIAGASARFAVTPAKLGLAYPHEDVGRLVAAVGRGQAARLLFAAQPIDAGEAARIGLVEECCASAGARAAELVEAIAANDPASLVRLKAMLNGAAKAENDAAFDACFDGAGFRQRLGAFLGRKSRSPDRA